MTSANKSPVSRTIQGSDGRMYVVRLTGAGVDVREKGKPSHNLPVAPDRLLRFAAKLDAKLPSPPPVRTTRSGVARGLLKTERGTA